MARLIGNAIFIICRLLIPTCKLLWGDAVAIFKMVAKLSRISQMKRDFTDGSRISQMKKDFTGGSRISQMKRDFTGGSLISQMKRDFTDGSRISQTKKDFTGGRIYISYNLLNPGNLYNPFIRDFFSLLLHAINKP